MSPLTTAQHGPLRVLPGYTCWGPVRTRTSSTNPLRTNLNFCALTPSSHIILGKFISLKQYPMVLQTACLNAWYGWIIQDVNYALWYHRMIGDGLAIAGTPGHLTTHATMGTWWVSTVLVVIKYCSMSIHMSVPVSVLRPVLVYPCYACTHIHATPVPVPIRVSVCMLYMPVALAVRVCNSRC